MTDRQEIAKRVRMALGAGGFRSRDEAAEKISAELGYEISREILRKAELGLGVRGPSIELLDAIADVCGVERELVRGDKYVFVPGDLRDLNPLKPLYLDLDPINVGVTDGGWFHRDEVMHLPNPDYWTKPLQSETLPIKVAS